jgi:hypothetical protein
MTLTSAAGAPRALRMTPGRWVAVALAVPVAIALIGWTGFTLVSTIARGSYPFSYPVLVHDGQVAVNVNEGNVTLRQAFGATARLTGTVQYGLVRPGITGNTTATGTSVGINCDGIASDCGMDATLVVPARTAVSLAGYGGDVAISGWTGHLALASSARRPPTRSTSTAAAATSPSCRPAEADRCRCRPKPANSSTLRE